jgi:hypothetical protein
MMMRIFCALAPLALLAACGQSDQGGQENSGLLPDGPGQGGATPNIVGAQSATTGPAVAKPVIEPVTSRERQSAGIEGKACQFARVRGSVPVFVAAPTGQTALIRLSGKLWTLKGSGGSAQRGGSFATEGASAAVKLSNDRTESGDAIAALTVTNAGGSETIGDGVYYCE